jgi:hypothetical protein
MDIVITVAAYGITMLATFFRLTGLIVGIGAKFGGLYIGGLASSFIIWLGISRIWIFLEGDIIPI